MAHTVLAPAADGDGVHLSIRFAGIEVGTVGGGTGMPHARAFLSLLGCAAEPGRGAATGADRRGERAVPGSFGSGGGGHAVQRELCRDAPARKRAHRLNRRSGGETLHTRLTPRYNAF